MSIYEVNRNTVKLGLARRKAMREEAAREAAQEAVSRGFRTIVNGNHQTYLNEMEAARKAQIREEERKEAMKAQKLADARLKKRNSREEEIYCMNCFLYEAIVAIPLLCAAIAVALHTHGILPLWPMVTLSVTASAISVYTFFARSPWINRKVAKKGVTALRRKIRNYLHTPISRTIE